MQILVVGGAGYVGSSLVPHLVDRGHAVDVVDLLWFGKHVQSYRSLRQMDLFNLGESDVAPYDIVVFMAGLSNDPMANYSPSKNFVQNTAAPAYLAYICKQAGVKRYVYASSCSIYGYTFNDAVYEDSATTCGYPYGASKLFGETSSMHFADPEFSVIALRKGTVSGYSPRMRLDLMVNTMFKSAMKDRVITVNNPAIWRSMVTIQDAVQAYTRAIEADSHISGIFNIGSENVTVGEVADLVKEAIGSSVRVEVKNIPDLRNYKVRWDKAVCQLGYIPKGNIQSVIQDLLDNCDKFMDWDNPNYYNVQVLRRLDSDETSRRNRQQRPSGRGHL